MLSNVDLQSQFQNKNTINISEFYNLLRNEMRLDIKLEELKNLNEFLLSQSQDDDQAEFLD